MLLFTITVLCPISLFQKLNEFMCVPIGCVYVSTIAIKALAAHTSSK